MTFQKEHLLEDGEEMLEKIRKHWIVYAYDLLIHIIGCLVFITAAVFLSSHHKLLLVSGLYGDYGAMVLVAFVILFWISFFFAWTKNYFDVWYITNQHIIAIDQKNIFERDEAFMELTRIQDVFFERNGFLANMFDFGQLKVQSAGTEQEFVIENVKDVEGCAHRLMDLRDKAHGRGHVLGIDV
jgi:uncharacterized membrane protein YdbT with pleckstrin-like domain